MKLLEMRMEKQMHVKIDSFHLMWKLHQGYVNNCSKTAAAFKTNEIQGTTQERVDEQIVANHSSIYSYFPLMIFITYIHQYYLYNFRTLILF